MPYNIKTVYELCFNTTKNINYVCHLLCHALEHNNVLDLLYNNKAYKRCVIYTVTCQEIETIFDIYTNMPGDISCYYVLTYSTAETDIL